MRDVFVDSSAWIAFFSASDGNHPAAHAAFARTLHRDRLFTSSLVVAEVHRLTLFRGNIRLARAVLARMTASDEVRVEHPSAALHAEAVTFLDRLADQAVTYTDAVSFAMMKRARCKVALTFDRHFRMAGFDTRP